MTIVLSGTEIMFLTFRRLHSLYSNFVLNVSTHAAWYLFATLYFYLVSKRIIKIKAYLFFFSFVFTNSTLKKLYLHFSVHRFCFIVLEIHTGIHMSNTSRFKTNIRLQRNFSGKVTGTRCM